MRTIGEIGTSKPAAFRRLAAVAAGLGVLIPLLSPAPAGAVVLHPGVAEPTAKPADAVVGRWNTNASAVAIGRENWYSTGYILTTRHQGYGVNSPVWFGGVEYSVAQIWNAPVASGQTLAPDLRICRIVNTAANGGGQANLTDFALWSNDTTEVNENIVVGGYGKTRGTAYSTYYEWAGANNQTLHWGRNTIDGVQSNFTVYNNLGNPLYVSDVLRFDFDGPATTDAAIAEYDSGGGWFYQDDGHWVVAGLSAYTDTGSLYRSYFVSPNNDNFAIRLSSYASWIDSVIEQYYYPSILGDANLDGVVDLDDLGILADNWGSVSATWRTGDFDFDSDVDLDDLGVLADNWGGGVSSPIPVNALPEPATLFLLGAGALALLRRRRP